jgi:hypothetical protein
VVVHPVVAVDVALKLRFVAGKRVGGEDRGDGDNGDPERDEQRAERNCDTNYNDTSKRDAVSLA